jgi:hypothetical protein
MWMYIFQPLNICSSKIESLATRIAENDQDPNLRRGCLQQVDIST